MRPLTKNAKPSVLVERETTWTVAYVAAKATGDEHKHEKWRHPNIKEALRVETSARCAYCEGDVEDVSFLHVEHIVPKGVRPDLAHIWENLTAACGQCNTAKGSFFHEVDGLLNPYVDRPLEHLIFLGGVVDWQYGSVRGEVTVLRMKLNRMGLVKARVERIMNIRNMLNAWMAASGVKRAVLEDAIRLDVAEGEFSAAVSAYVQERGFPIAAPTAG